MNQEDMGKQLLITSGILDAYQCKLVYLIKL